MEGKIAQFMIRGMQRDMSRSKFNPEFAYENMNVRITSRDHDSLLSITNEKGQKLIDTAITGTVLGYAVLNNYIVLFTHLDSNSIDYIYRIDYNPDDDSFTYNESYMGNLGFSAENYIETISIFENDEIQKIYWVDGKNQLRFINIVAKDNNPDLVWNDNSFDFIPTLALNETINIEKTFSGGYFPAGTVQYVFTYFNRQGAETLPFYISSTNYISYLDRGGSPEDIINNTFKITMNNLDSNFEFVRIYSLIWTTTNGTPIAKIVKDVSTSESQVIVIDDNSGGSIIDPSLLLHLSTKTVISPKTIQDKDNTLFVGNYSLTMPKFPDSIRDAFGEDEAGNYKQGIFISNETKTVYNDISLTGQYPYKNELYQDSAHITTFKSNEYYRCGVQFQNRQGSWSEVLWMGDFKSTYTPLQGKSRTLSVAYIRGRIVNSSLLRQITDLGYVKARPVIVYPSATDREVVMQGILCPTVYNLEDRFDNSPFVMSSWFARPNLPYDLRYEPYYYDNRNIVTNEMYYPASRNILANHVLQTTTYGNGYTENPNTGSWIEFRHNFPIPDNRMMHAEIQSIKGPIPPYVVNTDSRDDVNIWVRKNREFCYVDQSILTFHSPEIEFNESIQDLDTSALKMRLVGVTQLTATASDISLTTKTAPSAKTLGFYKSNVNVQNINQRGFKGLASTPVWLDDTEHVWYSSGVSPAYLSYVVYPWHRQGSLSNRTEPAADQILKAELDTKQLSNLRYSFFNEYITPINISTYTNTERGIADVQIFNSNEQTMLKLKRDSVYDLDVTNSEYESITYYGNVDKILKISLNNGNEYYLGNLYGQRRNEGYRIVYSEWGKSPEELQLGNIHTQNYYWLDTDSQDGRPYVDNNYPKFGQGIEPVRLKYNSTPHAVVVLDKDNVTKKTVVLPAILNDGRPGGKEWGLNYVGNTVSRFAITGSTADDYIAPISGDTRAFWEPQSTGTPDRNNNDGREFEYRIKYMGYRTPPTSMPSSSIPEYNYMGSPQDGDIFVRISTTGFTMFQYSSTTSSWETAPKYGYFYHEDEWGVIRHYTNYSDTGFQPQNDIIQGTVKEPAASEQYGHFWMAELYNDSIGNNRFGGKSTEALESNVWTIAGEPVSLLNSSGMSLTNITLNYVEGDTYYQRYDCLKTYSNDITSQNSIVDIVSFMVETRINIDGRYDRNRGRASNLVASPTNFNLLNKNYSKSSFFNQYYLNPNRVSSRNFPNSITWSGTKLLGEEIDSWTNISLLNNLEFDGNKSELRTILKYNNDLFAFQDKGISNILYNSRTQIQSSESNPILIANSGKVDGKIYISEIGTSNRGSIKVTPAGVYFIDGLTNGIYLFDGQGVRCLSDELGFRNWIGENVNNNEWNVAQFGNFVTHYDESNADIYFINKEFCLVYSEYLRQFTSFMSYNGTPFMFNVDGKFLSVSSNGDSSYMYEQEKGDYNMFYFNGSRIPNYRPFYTTVIANQEEPIDKIFTNVEFRADFFDGDTYLPDITYDNMEVWNEYQKATSNLQNIKHKPSPLKKKFRMWRADIPRANSNNRDRMRNPWLFVKLGKYQDNNYRSELHDLMVYYYR